MSPYECSNVDWPQIHGTFISLSLSRCSIWGFFAPDICVRYVQLYTRSKSNQGVSIPYSYMWSVIHATIKSNKINQLHVKSSLVRELLNGVRYS